MKLPSLNVQILLGAIFGVALGFYFHTLGAEHHAVQNGLYASGLVATLFIDLLKMILIPLVFCSISVGIANLRQHQQMQHVWVYTLLFFVSSMAIAIVLGMSASLYFKPGSGLSLPLFEQAMHNFSTKEMSPAEFINQFLHGLFVNPFAALAGGNVLAVVIFALFLGVALVIGGERYKSILALLQEGLGITMLIVGWVMRLAPLGIMALLIKLVAVQDVVMLGTSPNLLQLLLGHFYYTV